MIRLSCTNCREVLTIDDAFAGGVCRCQHCGTIQTVPAATAANEVAVGGPNLGGGRNGSVYGGAAASGTGLDDLAGAIASSGLSSRRLLRPDGTAATGSAHARPAGRKSVVPLFVVAGVVIVLLMGTVIYLATRGTAPAAATGTESPAANPGGTVMPRPTPAAAGAPNFCGSPLAGDTVVYLLDRGGSTQEIFGSVRDAALKSAASLGSGRHFQIVFWDNGSDPAAYPLTGTAYATKENVDSAKRAIDDVIAFGQTDVKPALTAALAQHPDTIVIATAKGWQLDDQWAKDVLSARGASVARIDTFSLGGTPPPEGAVPPLKTVANRTGGTYAEVTNADLRAAGE